MKGATIPARQSRRSSVSTYDFRPVIRRLEEWGWSQAELERHIDVSSGMVSHWKVGRRAPSKESRRKLDDFLAEQEFDLGKLEETVPKLPKLERPPPGTKQPTPRRLNIDVLGRNPRVQAWTLQQAKGRCELCRKPAPFKRPDGRAFLEVHHVKRLAEGGEDVPDNTVALCPNCHRMAHYGDVEEVQEKLTRIVSGRGRRANCQGQ